MEVIEKSLIKGIFTKMRAEFRKPTRVGFSHEEEKEKGWK